MFADYFKIADLDKKIPTAIAVLDPPGSPFDLYIGSMYLESIDISKSYQRTANVFLNILLLKRFLEKSALRNVLILLTDRYINDISLLTDLGHENFVFCLSRKPRVDKVKNVYIQNVPLNCSDKEFEYKAGSHLKRLLEEKTQSLNISQPFPTKIDSLKELSEITNINTYRFESEILIKGFRFSFLCNFKPWTSKLVIVNQSAIDVSRQSPPVYQRWKWADDFNATVLILNDPMLYIGDRLNGGWMVGSKEVDLIYLFVQEVKKVLKKMRMNNNDVVFYGGSAGGFTSLQMASCLRNSTAIVDIPQTDLTRYQHITQIIRAFEAGFGVNSYKEIKDNFLERLSVIPRMKKENSEFNLIFLQNINDEHHVRVHFIPLIKYISKRTRINYSCFIYDIMHPVRGGHYPLGRYETTTVVNEVLRLTPRLPKSFAISTLKLLDM